jgi:membrane protease YdiL (CAAX protease family)
MFVQWGLVIILLIYWFITNRSLNDLFFINNPLFSIPTKFLWTSGIGAGFGIIMLVVLFSFSKTMRKNYSDALSDASIQFLIPSSLRERLLFLFVSITAGVCEEIIFRGAFLYYLNHLPFELSIIAIGIISSLLFGIVHLYQGWKGVFLTSYFGGILFFLFVATGNLWIPIVLHFLIDAKFVFLPNKKPLSIDIETKNI